MSRTIEKIDYGEVLHSTLLTIFGDEMTYNELKFYARDKEGTTYLEVEWNRDAETQLVRVWFDKQVVMDKKYDINHSCDMFNYLSELEAEQEEDEDAEEAEQEEDENKDV
jgi:hypothetical protein